MEKRAKFLSPLHAKLREEGEGEEKGEGAGGDTYKTAANITS